MTNKLSKALHKYVEIRDKKKEIQNRHKKELEPYNDALEKLERYFLQTMDDMGLDQLKADDITAYPSVIRRASVKDRNDFLEFLLESECWHLADLRASDVAVREYMEDEQDIVPGVELNEVRRCNVRKS